MLYPQKKLWKINRIKKEIFWHKKSKILKTKSNIYLYFRVLHSSIPLWVVTIWVLPQFEFCHNFCFEFCCNFSFWVLSHFELFSFETFFVFEFCPNLRFSVLSKFEVLSFVKIWAFQFCYTLSFSQFEFCKIFEFSRDLSFWLLSPKLKCHKKTKSHHNRIVTKTEISSKLKCHQNWNVTKTKMLPNIIMSSKSKSKSKRLALITLVLFQLQRKTPSN